MTQPSEKFTSPCIRNCCLDNNDICIGCKRTIDEIVEWSQATDERKAVILASVARRRVGQK
ncbi:DUF1289 domain-containing protein [Agaribacter flavus]|uniref:DUF1289 domain-containing protein n=1 Tax=Agaribacter flavus TaxID=1902781 RepID=A0ABV7FPM6_9ALTE